ncbi:ABC transporter permease [Fulvivirgaceae bacterium BMA12]|uniref:ABC transporter permease n=1 Tax=Agaribacillus aureus TaxID=3051825 RepID=A0ABT8L815_9BACT|nr:ABC transporter permease [Fulvivirgaceae bacterium BMA12]
MLRNYLKTTWRSLLKNRVFSLINILGLSIGLTACLLILQYVTHELSYDNFHQQKEDIYRIQQNRFNKGILTTQWAAGCAGIGPALKENFPEVKAFVKLHGGEGVISYKDNRFRENRAYYATETFFQVFSYPLISGVDSLVLNRPNTVVLSESTAKKYFNEEDPIGKRIKHNGHVEYEVTGIFKDVPENTHMKFDLLFSFDTYVALTNERALTAWNWDGFYTYIQLASGTDHKTFENKLPAFVEQQQGEALRQYSADVQFLLQPIDDIHLSPNYMGEFEPNSDRKTTFFLLIVAFFIMVIAWINYINLATAKSLERAREVGIRKVMGSFRRQLIRQFLFESCLLNVMAVFLAIAFVILLLPAFNQLTGKTLTFSLFAQLDFWLALIALFLVGSFLSGLYPSLVLSGFRPIAVLKGKFKTSSRGTSLRKGLVIFQFFSSVILIAGTYAVYQQITFMKSQDLGVEVDKTLVVRAPNVTDSTYNDKFSAFKNELLNISAISKVASSTAVPGRQPGWNAGGIRRVHEDESQSNQYRVIGVDYDFKDAFQLEVLAGRNFSKEFGTDRETVLFNQSATKLMGFKTIEEALGEDIFFWGDTFRIVGVLKDYHQESLKKSFEPLIFRLIPGARPYYSIKLNANNPWETISQIQSRWNFFFTDDPFEYFFLDDHYNQQYQADLQFGRVFGTFSSLAIFIACLGLFGLTSFMAVQKTKEIGIRKVMGATVSNILSLLLKDFTRLVLVAVMIAIPVSWWMINNWLERFAYKIGLSWWLFAIPGLLVMMIALLTASYQTIKSSLANPVDSLRYE